MFSVDAIFARLIIVVRLSSVVHKTRRNYYFNAFIRFHGQVDSSCLDYIFFKVETIIYAFNPQLAFLVRAQDNFHIVHVKEACLNVDFFTQQPCFQYFLFDLSAGKLYDFSGVDVG